MGRARFTVGDKGVSRVTIYRRENSPGIYIEWWDDQGRHRQVLKDAEGNRVTKWETAKKIAKRGSELQREKRNRLAAEYFGVASTEDRTLAELFRRRHDDLGPGWSTKYAKSRELRRRFWLARLGEKTPLKAVNAAAVERVAREAQAEKKTSDRWRQDVLRYIVDSFSYAEKKLKWIEAKANLSAVSVPSAKGTSRAYTLAEAKRLIPAMWKVGPVAGWIVTVAFQTGRRIGAILALGPGDVTVDGDRTIIRFAGETDKARRTGEAVVYGLPERTDWRLVTYDDARDWLRTAEKDAGVPYVSGRGFHGLKRLYATLTKGMAGRALQAGTLDETLKNIYEQDILEPKAEVAKVLAGKLE